MARPDRLLPNGKIGVHRHPALVRASHWINALAFLVMLTSGLQIFNAHPALYLGKASAFEHPVLSMVARQPLDGGAPVGITTLFGRESVTTGLFGASREGDMVVERGFPAWITLPSNRDLATARLWHFFFAWVLAVNGAVYLGLGLFGGRIRRELAPTRAELGRIGVSIADHLRLRFPKGEAARRYNVLQKLSYLAVVFLLFPLMILTGMTMSPGLDAAAPGLLEVFGGRQSARTLHFITAAGLSLFLLVHLAMVVLAGPINEVRSMITGRYVIDPRADREAGG